MVAGLAADYSAEEIVKSSVAASFVAMNPPSPNPILLSGHCIRNELSTLFPYVSSRIYRGPLAVPDVPQGIHLL